METYMLTLSLKARERMISPREFRKTIDPIITLCAYTCDTPLLTGTSQPHTTIALCADTLEPQLTSEDHSLVAGCGCCSRLPSLPPLITCVAGSECECLLRATPSYLWAGSLSMRFCFSTLITK